MAMAMDCTSISEILQVARRDSETFGGAQAFDRFVGQLVIPGMVLEVRQDQDIKSDSVSWSLRSGLIQIPSSLTNAPAASFFLLVRKLGILKYAAPPVASKSEGKVVGANVHRVWIDSMPLSGARNPSQLCGAPQDFHVSQFAVNDRVLGVVRKKAGDIYLVDIGCASNASLNFLAFEGASKKNRPDIRLKDVIYASIAQADPDLEIELTCVDEAGKASGMGIMGRHEPGSVGNAGGMKGGVMLYCSLELVSRLSDAANFPLLSRLSKKFPFEICVACNGRIWLTARSPRETMLLANTISLADYVPPEVCLGFVDELC